MKHNANKLHIEVVYGGKAIGKIINEPNLPRVDYHLSHNNIPGATKLGNRWVLSVPAWRKFMRLDT